MPNLITPGVIARELGVPLHRVVYVLRTRPHLVAAARAGNLRLYRRETVAAVASELHEIADRRGGGAGSRAPLALVREVR